MNHKDAGFTRKMYLNTVAMILDYVATLLVAFITSPLLLSYLGKNVFGIWSICRRLLSYVSAADGRATQALKSFVANKQNSDDFAAKRRDVGCAVAIWILFLPVLIISGLVVVWVSPYLIKDLAAEYFWTVRFTCAVLVLNMIMMPLYTVPEAVLGGSNQLHKCMGVNPLAAIAGGALMVTAAYIGWGLVGLASALVAATIIRGVFVLRVTNNSVTWFGIERPSRSEVRHFFGFSGLVLCWTLIERVMLTGDVVLMGFVISAEKAASYSLSQYAMQTSIAVTALTVFAVVPGLGDIVGRRDFQKAGKIRSEIMSGTWLVSTIFGSAILLLNRSFVELWVGNDIFIGRIENFLMVILMMQLIFIRTDACVIDVTLNIKKKVMLGGMSTVLSIGLAYVFAQTWESRVSGLIVGLILGQALLTLSYPVLVNSAFGLSMRKGICCIIRPLLATVFMFSAAMYAQECLEIESWPTLILFGFGAVAVIVLTAFFAGLSAEQRAQLMKRIRHIRARKADNQ